MADKHPYAVEPVPKFDFSVLDEGVLDLMRNHTAVSFAVERIDFDEKERFENFGWRHVPFIVRYEFTRRRSLSRAGELEIIISKRLHPAFKESREWKESNNKVHQYLEKEYNETVTFSSISAVEIYSFDEETAIFQFEQRTERGPKEVLKAPWWSKFGLPCKRDKGILQEVLDGFRSILKKMCGLSKEVEKELVKLARDEERQARQQLSSSDDDEYTSSAHSFSSCLSLSPPMNSRSLADSPCVEMSPMRYFQHLL
jgi:hypothetical protein